MLSRAYCDYCNLPVPGAGGGPQVAAPGGPIYCCYGCKLAAGVTRARGEEGQVNWLLTRLGVAVFLSMAVMVFSFFQYGREVYEADAAPASPLASSLAGLMRYISLVFATPVFVILGLPILSAAWTQFRNRIVSTDALVVIGVAAAFVYSYISTLTDRGATYYETACMILVLVTLGRWLEATGKLKASAAVQALEELIPAEVSVRRDGETMTLHSEQVRAGDLLLVAAGQRIAADGTIEQGQAQVDEQVVTGESAPVVKQVGDTVRAGTVDLDGGLAIRATAVGSDSTLGRLMRLLDQAKRCKGRYERLADRVA
ncbi:MAG: P-type ATPase, partial [Planctomycetota bacterium]